MIHHLDKARTRKLSTPKVLGLIASTEGRVLPPLLLYMLGVPGVVVILLWIFVFRSP